MGIPRSLAAAGPNSAPGDHLLDTHHHLASLSRRRRAARIAAALALASTFGAAPSWAAPCGVCGDVNDSGSVDFVDARFVAQRTVGLRPSLTCAAQADVNGDGSPTIVDALFIAQYTDGLRAPLACPNVCAGVTPVSGTAITATRVASGLSKPLYVTAPPLDTTRVFIVEQTGRIKILTGGSIRSTPFLDLTAKVSCCGERGLLGLAFHPRYASTGRFFVDYTDTAGNTVVAEYRVSADPNVATTTETVLLRITQPFSNHNGGHLAFGPDGYLYIASGDGGSGGDPQGNGQNLSTRLGKILRIDVDSASPYAIPPTNPFAGATPGDDAIWAYGVRNPWRNSFDRLTGDLYIADVGQNAYEEINYQPVSSSGGTNYGWNIVEGNGHCFSPSTGCNQTGLTLPVHEYSHALGCSVTGGYVYRGCALPDLRGTYFYGDYCSAFVRTFQIVGGIATNHQDRTAALESSGVSIDSISSFGEDGRGELYITDLGGEVFKIVPQP